MIAFHEVSRQFSDGTHALSSVTFSVQPGEFIFLVGPSGAGKTTLLRFLIREDLPTSGEVWFKEENICLLPLRRVPELRRQISLVFQDFRLLERKTAYENVSFALEVANKEDAEIGEVTEFLIDQVGLSHRAHAYPHQLSAGEAQRVSIARAMVHEPEVLLADEPTGNLDPGCAWEIIKLLEKINSWGTTIIMATHNQQVVDALKKRVISLDKGRIISDEHKGRYRDLFKSRS